MEKVITGQFQITKFITDGDHSEIVQPEKDAEFTAVLKKYVDQYGSVSEAIKHKDEFADAEWDVLTTNENGIAVSKELAYGTYIVEQTKGAQDTENVPSFTFTVSQANQDMKYYHINNKPLETYVKIVKKDAESGKTVALAGATFKIKDADGNYVTQKLGMIKVDTFVTNADGIVMTPLKLDAGDYTLEEITAPNGYVLNKEEIPFTITASNIAETDEDGDPITVVECNDQAVKGTISIEKKGEVLTGAKENENGGIDFVYETRNIEGAVIEIRAKEDILDPADGTVLYEAGTLMDTVTTSKEGPVTSKELPLGTYTVTEVKAPYGFVLDSTPQDVTLAYADQNTPLVTQSKTIADERQKVEVTINKFDEKGAPLAGADFALYANRDVYDYDGNVIVKANTLIATAVSDKDGKVSFDVDLPTDMTPEYGIMPLEDNSSTTIHGTTLYGDPNALFMIKETKAPAGYVAEDAIYYVDAAYTEQTEDVVSFDYAVTNKTTKVEISKVDLTNEEELPGAHLQVIDKETGKVVDEWVSKEEAHLIEGLEQNKTYVLQETIPAEGYATASDIEFVVEDTAEIQTVIMKDDVTKLEVSKQDITTGKELPGAELEIIGKETNEVIDHWTSTEEAHYIEKLVVDKEYILRETIPAEGYATAQDIIFKMNDTAEIQKIVMKDEIIQFNIEKRDAASHEMLAGAQLQLIDKESGKVIDEWTSGKEAHHVEKLVVGKEYIVREKEAPKGYAVADDITFTVADTGKVQTVMMYDKEIVHTGAQIGSVAPFGGAMLISLAALTFVISKRRKEAK